MRERSRAPGGAHRERAHLARGDVRLHRQRPQQCHLHLSTEQPRDRRRGALVAHIDHVESGGKLEHLQSQMRCAANSAAGIIELAGLGAQQREQFGNRLRRHRRMHHEHKRHFREQRYRLEAPDRIVGQVAAERRIDRMRAGNPQYGVAVRRGARCGSRAQHAAASRTVIDHHLLTQRLGKRFGEQPRGDVGAAAGGNRRNHADRPGRISLGIGMARGPDQHRRGEQRASCRPAPLT
jgi:hypothetical protein